VSSSDPPRKDHSASISVVISVLTTLATIAAAWGALSERARIDTESITELKREVEALKAERAESARMSEQLKGIALDVSELKSDLKTVDAKVSAIRRR
jgi:hypothetical protein